MNNASPPYITNLVKLLHVLYFFVHIFIVLEQVSKPDNGKSAEEVLKSAAIIGGVVGGILLLIIIAIVVSRIILKNRQEEQEVRVMPSEF